MQGGGCSCLLGFCGWRRATGRAVVPTAAWCVPPPGAPRRRSPPNIYFKKKKTGGVSINSTLQLTKMDDKLIQRILQEYKIHNCEVSCTARVLGV